MGGVFAVGRTLEAIFLREATASLAVILDVLLWGGLGGLAVWGALTWASRQEQRHQSELEHILRRQQQLNQQLQRVNGQLALLSEVNRLEILRRVAAGYDNRRVAAQLFLSEKTVGNRLSEIFQKLQVSNRTQAARVAIERGLLSPLDVDGKHR
jgi:DNA-binding CsgD family transcriptional regulator